MKVKDWKTDRRATLEEADAQAQKDLAKLLKPREP
jgi:hypothetical protein